MPEGAADSAGRPRDRPHPKGEAKPYVSKEGPEGDSGVRPLDASGAYFEAASRRLRTRSWRETQDETKLRKRAPNSLKSLLRVNLCAAGYRRGRVGQCSRSTANKNAVDRPNSIMPFSASIAPINCQCFARNTSAWP
jgi:hypothetical protein